MDGSKKDVYVVPHAHIDLAWYWTYEETKGLLQSIFGEYLLPLMERDPDFRFTQDQALLFEELERALSPETWERFRALVAEGKIEPAGGMYVQPEFAQPCGESIVRQLQYGQRAYEKLFGRRSECLWNIDSFGQTPQLPQLALLSGIRRMVFMRGMPYRAAPEKMPTEFWLKGPDGSAVLAHWMAETYFIGRHSPLYQKLYSLSSRAPANAVMLPFGADLYRHDLPSGEVARLVKEAAELCGIGIGEVKVATASEFFDAVEAGGAELAELEPDLTPPLYIQDLRGTYENRIELKLANRRAERLLLALEMLLALAGRSGEPAEGLWKEALYCQFHDIIAGSCIDRVYLDAMRRYAAVCEEAQELAGSLLGYEKCGMELAVFNPSAGRSAPVEAELEFPKGCGLCGVSVSDGDSPVPAELGHVEYRAEGSVSRARLRFTSGLPGYGFKTFHLKNTTADAAMPPEPVVGTAVENEFFRVEVCPSSGNVKSVYHKPSGKELLAGEGNILLFEEEREPDMEGALSPTGQAWSDEYMHAESTLREVSPISERIRAVKQCCGYTITKEICLVHGEDLVRFSATIDVKEKQDRLIWARFPVAPGGEPVYDVPFAHAERPHGHYPAQYWAGLRGKEGTVALLNKGTCGYRTTQGAIDMALLRCFAGFQGYQVNRGANGFTGESAGSCELAAELGSHTFEYALAFNKDVSALAKQGHAYNFMPLAVQCGGELKLSLVEDISPNILITSIQPAKNGGFIVRGYETGGIAGEAFVRLSRAPVRCESASLTGDEYEPVLHQGRKLAFPVKRHGIFNIHVALE